MTPAERKQALLELGDQMVAASVGIPQLWQRTKSQLSSPVAVDRFVLQLHTAADALMILSQRAAELAGDLLDGEED